jgi:ribonuclease HII
MPFRLPPAASTAAFMATVSGYPTDPRKKRCSRKWETPFLARVSWREPVRT